MLFRLFMVIATLAFTSNIYAQSMLVGDRIAVFYPADFDSTKTLPSLALKVELQKTADLPSDWDLVPEFNFVGGKYEASLELPSGVHTYGTGEVTGPLVRNNTSITLWNTDNYGYGKDNGRRLYQSHPWVMGVNPDGSAFGIIADHSWKQDIEIQSDIRFISEGPPFRVIIIKRESPQALMKALGHLIGTMPLPPLWSLGYQQCRYSYYPDTRVKEIADEFRKRGIPCDVIWMDIDYMDQFKVFTFDQSRFPDPAGLNQYLHNLNFKSVWMIDPGIKEETGYFVYDQGTTGDHWVQDANRNTYIGDVWPGACAFPDYTMPGTRNWWAGLYTDFMATGADGIWNDMNEPAVFNGPDNTMPEDNIHRGGGELPEDSHLRYHNVYGMLMVKASREGIQNSNPDKRPFVLSRANFLGGQRYAATWTGDNNSSWEHLRLSIPMSLNLSLSGQPFNGPDIGGFAGTPGADLMAHWMAVGAFYPFSRNHTSTGTADQEPWAFGETVEKASRIALQRRYRLLPYLYEAFYETYLNGMPVMRPVFFADPTDIDLREEEEAFLLGENLMIIPRWSENVAMPQGNWREISIVNGDNEDEYQPVLRQKDGSIIPLGPIVQSTEEYKADSITLLVSVDESNSAFGSFYADAGNGYEYQNGQYLIREFSASPMGNDSLLIVIKNVEGSYTLDNLHRVGVVTKNGIRYSDWSSNDSIKVFQPIEIDAQWIKPSDDAVFDEGEDILLKIEVSPADQITSIKFKDQEGITLANVSSGPFEWLWEDVKKGLYQIRAEVETVQGTVFELSEKEILVGAFGSGGITRQVWNDIGGVEVGDLLQDSRYPDSPDLEEEVTRLVSPENTGDNYGQRLIGYIVPPVSGRYRFFISGDDYCELWLSTDEQKDNLSLIAEVPGWSLKGEWSKYSEQSSSEINLEEGKKYMLVALHKEAGGDDFVEVQWQMPGGPRSEIRSEFLAPLVPEDKITSNHEFSLERIAVYPNPADKEINIKLRRITTWSIVDMSGKVWQSQNHTMPDQYEISLNTENWPSGVYFLKAIGETNSITKKIMVFH
jgi:alpha-glucosidase